MYEQTLQQNLLKDYLNRPQWATSASIGEINVPLFKERRKFTLRMIYYSYGS